MNTLTKNAAWILLSFVIIGAALSISNAEAETKVYLGAWSTHLVTDGDFNEIGRASCRERVSLLV